jgi:hypothetical protein
MAEGGALRHPQLTKGRCNAPAHSVKARGDLPAVAPYTYLITAIDRPDHAALFLATV